MTLDRARKLSTRWLVAAVAALVIRAALGMVGIDLLDLPLGAVVTLGLMLSMRHSGWIDGHRAATREEQA